jgi:hypothetical protein
MKLSSLCSLAVYISLATAIFANNVDSILNNTTISLITCDPGDEIYSYFGHSAIRIKNQTNDIVYNYGTFDFNTPNFTMKFMRGKLPYRLTAYSFDRFLDEYHYFKRGVREQILNITIEQKKSIIAYLDMNLRPENREYKYDFFFDNCSSRIRDVFEKTLNLNSTYISDTVLTLRDQLHQYQKSHPWTELGIDMIIGSKSDIISDPRQQMFLPDYLHDNLSHSELNGSKLLFPSKELLSYEEDKLRRNSTQLIRPLTLNIILLLLFSLLYYFQKINWINALTNMWYVIAGIGGLIIIFLWFFTDHQATKANWNILWLNPLFFVLLFKESKIRNTVKTALTISSIMVFINCFIHFIPQAMPYQSCIVPAFVFMIWREWFSKENFIQKISFNKFG